MMRCFTYIIILLSATVYSHQDLLATFQQAVDKVSDKCIEESGANADLVKNLFTGERVDDRKVKCYIKCVLVAMGYMDDDGNVHLDGFKDNFPRGPERDKIIAIENRCKSVKAADACETAYVMHVCAMKDLLKGH